MFAREMCRHGKALDKSGLFICREAIISRAGCSSARVWLLEDSREGAQGRLCLDALS